MPYNIYETFLQVVTLVLLGNGQPSVACRTSSYACKTYSGKRLVLLDDFRRSLEEWKLIRELQWTKEACYWFCIIPVLWMRTLSTAAIPNQAILDICLWVESCPVHFSVNLHSALKEWAKHLSFKKWK